MAIRPCGLNISTTTTKSRVQTLAMDPDMKNSRIDRAWDIPKADSIVPNKDPAPPKTTTKKVSTI